MVSVPVNDDFKVTAKELDKVVKRLGFWRWKKVKGLILSSPSNPTGAMLTPDELKGLCEYCDKKGITFISDEIYHHISYGKPEASGELFLRVCDWVGSGRVDLEWDHLWVLFVRGR